jgi:DNA-binding transcriptional LysR family regulator
VALLTPEARDFRSDEPVVLCEQVGPGTVADGCGTDGRVDDVGEEQGGEDAVRLRLVVESADEALDLVERGVAIALPGQMVVARQLDDAEVGGSSDRLRPRWIGARSDGSELARLCRRRVAARAG